MIFSFENFLILSRSQEHREEVRAKCVTAEPHHGLVWQAIAKDLKNNGKSIREILEMVADVLQ